MKFFGGSKKPSSSSKKAHDSPGLDDIDTAAHRPRSEPSSPTKAASSPRSPKKSSRPSSHIEPKPALSSSSSARPSRSSRHQTDHSTSSRRAKFDPDTHPLNLPPEERRRLSALSTAAMSGNNSMDIDQEPVNGTPTSPQQNTSAQANFSVPIPNGTNHEDAPAPPPHKSNPSSPTPTPEEDAEAYKGAGNRFFKEKNYTKAIEQYSKGLPLQLR